MKMKANFGDFTNFDIDRVQGTNVADITPNMTPPSNRPQGCKRAKEDQKAKKQTKNNSITCCHKHGDSNLDRTAIIRN
jgi:hypothetical protein